MGVKNGGRIQREKISSAVVIPQCLLPQGKTGGKPRRRDQHEQKRNFPSTCRRRKKQS